MLNEEYLKECYYELNKDAAAGVDGVDYYEYEKNLDGNIQELVKELKTKSHRAKLIRRQYIPKTNGKLRPLGIPSIADKVIQYGVSKILEAIYEADFQDSSYGYRPGRGPKDAVKKLTKTLQIGRYTHIVEEDIKRYFDNIDHGWLVRMLEKRIKDKAFIRLIKKWLKAGILETDGSVIHPATGTPQGAIASPILANIYLHFVLDMWFEKRIKSQSLGEAMLIRFADDFVCLFKHKRDAEMFYNELKEGLLKFGLEVAEDKTKILLFSKWQIKRSETFEFLGFEFSCGISRKGRPQIKRKTARKKLKASVWNFTKWIKTNRNTKISTIMRMLAAKYRGYWNYYGVIGNYNSLKVFCYQTKRILFKWLNRRSQKLSYNWQGFTDLLKQFAIPGPRITEPYDMPKQQKLFV